MRTIAGSIFLAFSLSIVVGCSRGKGGAPQSPPPTAATPPADVKPLTQEPEPEPEPVPGEMVRLSLPRDGGAWPWIVGKADEPPASRPATFKGVGLFSITGFAVRPEVNRAVVTIRNDPPPPPKKGVVDPKKGPLPESTRVAVIDTTTGEAVAGQNWNVPGSYAVLDLSGPLLDPRDTLSGKIAASCGCGRRSSGQLARWPCTAHSPRRNSRRPRTKPDAASRPKYATRCRRSGCVDVRAVSFACSTPKGPNCLRRSTRLLPTRHYSRRYRRFPDRYVRRALDPAARKITGNTLIGTPQHPVPRSAPTRQARHRRQRPSAVMNRHRASSRNPIV